MRDLPVRGPGVRDLALRLPPERMARLRAGRPLKRWRYLGVYRPDVMLCVADARVAGVRQRWWAVALPDGTLLEGSRGVELSAERAFVRDVLDLELDEPDGVEVVSPHRGRPYIWTRKHAPVHVRGRVTAAGRTSELDGDDGFTDESAGYHARHTVWRWSAGIGRSEDGRGGGLEPRGRRARRAVVERANRLGRRRAARGARPQEFAADLSSVGGLRFREWSLARVEHERVGDAKPLPAAFRRVQR